MKPLDPESPRGRLAEAELNAVLASVARRREREHRQAHLRDALLPQPISKPA